MVVWVVPSQGDAAGTAGTDVATELDTQLSGAVVDPHSSAFERGQLLGRYVVIEKIGAGGMGVVYAAYDPELDRRVALKLMHERVSMVRETEGSEQTSAAASNRRRGRLLAEAQAMARLSHPNVITVHDVGTIGEQVFIAMEFVEGQPLSKWMRQPGRSWREILDVFVKAGRGLEAAHRVGLVHRDFKPDNVLVANTGEVRVLDFGLARLTEAEPDLPDEDATSSWRHSSLSKQTLASRVGTPAYMSPEQHLGHACDVRSDQFSFCVACYEGLYGERPFEGSTAMELALAISDGALVEAPKSTKVPGRIRKTLLRGLSSHPDERFGDMATLLAELQRDPTPRLRRAAPAIVIGLGALVAGAVLSVDDPQVCTGAGAKLAPVWSSERADGIKAAFVATGAPYAETSWASVTDLLDEYASSWTGMHTEACEATALRHEQSESVLDRRMICLGQRLAALDQLAAVLEEADRTTVERSVATATGLPGLEHCADIEALMAGEEPPPPGAERDRLEEVDRELARVRALSASGRFKDAESAAEVALALARDTGSTSREARATMALAAYHMSIDDGAAAEPLLYRAIELADGVGEDTIRARALATMIQALASQDRFDEARRFARMARAAFTRIGDPPVGSASIERSLGVVSIRQGRLREAKEHIELALEYVLKENDETSPAYLNTLNNLALAERDLGEYTASMEKFVHIREEWIRQYGEDHPGSAMMRMNVGTVLSTLGRQDEAIEEYERALKTFEVGIGPDCLDVGYTAESLAIALGEKGDYEAALKQHARAQSVFRKHGDQTNLALSLDNMGVVFTIQGDLERALSTHEEAYAMWREAVGDPEHPDLGYPLGHVAQDLWKLGRVDEARPKFEEAIRLFEKAGAAPNEIAEIRFNLAKSWRDEDPARARRIAEQARSEYTGMGEDFADRVARIDAFLSAGG